MDTEEKIHRLLASYNHTRLTPGLGQSSWTKGFKTDVRCQALELEMLEDLLSRVKGQASQAPTTPHGFLEWLHELKSNGPGQNDPLFPWLAEHATIEEMRWFLTQELAGEAGFDDLVAMTQVKLPESAKMELARNYWDEMGRGHKEGQHGLLLSQTAAHLNLTYDRDATVWESLALANVMTAFAVNRRHAHHSLGALGVIEMTAPARVGCVDQGLKRLGIPAADRRYFTLHAVLDVHHSEAWNREVFAPLVAENPETARAFAEGALMRLSLGESCFNRYRLELGISTDTDFTKHSPSPSSYENDEGHLGQYHSDTAH